ncbi:tricorn protease homolog 1 [Arthrobacter sp. Hiyo4]|nr:tricorn protease homolog 1 [Arthrobacter sp. Hiyo4]
MIILADEFAGSDGDIITQVSKLRGIGPVIGTRTWGGVVGIDNRFSLADGTGVTQPRYATWFGGGVGWSVETTAWILTSRCSTRRTHMPQAGTPSWNTGSVRSRK